MTVDFDEVASLKARITQLEKAEADLIEQQNAAINYVTAVVAHAVGIGVTFGVSNKDMEACAGLMVRIARLEDGGLALRVDRPDAPEAEEAKPLILEHNPVLAKAERPIILLDTVRGPNE